MPDIKMLYTTSLTRHPFKASLALTALMLLGSARPGLAADWGYDDIPDVHATAPPSNGPKGNQAGTAGSSARPSPGSGAKGKRNPGRLQNSQPGAAAGQLESTPQSQRQTDETSLTREKAALTPKAPSPEEIAAHKKVDDLKSWMEIFALAASSASEDDRNQILTLGTLPQDTRKKLEKMTFEKLEENVAEYAGISSIWRPLSQKITEDIDYKESYRLLFRSLLRHAVGRIEPTAPEAEAIQEILGPARIAEMGPPILTEDAINAYSDMTCFLYQKRHPDHTVEGDDNRQLFAEVVRQRYNDAPNLEAKKAMCNFDVTWASFRCRYLDSTAADREKLLASIGEDKSGTVATVSDRGTNATTTKVAPASARSKTQSSAALVSPKLLKIFALGPWAESSKTIPVAVKMSQMSEPTK
jgi:hypothetical protein